jgi:hypothetical protein
MLPRQEHETSTCRLQVPVGRPGPSLHLVKGGRVYVVLAGLFGLVGCSLEERGRSYLRC